MSELTKELIKIVADKGLLALIVLGVAFYLNRAIERYKAKNVYYQKLSDTRLEVYRELSKLVTAQTENLMAIIRFSTDAEKLKTKEHAELVDEVMQLHEKLRLSHDATRLASLENSVFLSPSLMDALQNSLDLTHGLNRLLLNPEQIGNPENLKDVGEISKDCWANVQKTLRKEINKSPFE
ncbi:MAG: hypothetical protein M3362_01560 [Acidobacteriota bacterium]|nr:hypothetical protein [Acidobacteriota bacterium]